VKPLGVKNVYYICPQFWAWRPWRANLVRRRFALALCIFPFEEKFFADAGVPVKFIGHPLVGQVRAALSRQEFAGKHELRESYKTITILPGSRPGRSSVTCRLWSNRAPNSNGNIPASTILCWRSRQKRTSVRFAR